MSIADLITALEKNYKAKIEEINANHNRNIEELEDKNLKLEKIVKDLNEKYVLTSEGQKGSKLITEKKVYELLENEKRLLAEIDSLKEERDSKIMEYQKLLDAELEKFKSKITELENKNKETEMKRTALLFEHEKERAQ